MTDQEIFIELDDDTEGHQAYRGSVTAKDTEWLQETLRSDSGTEGGQKRFRMLPADGDDTADGEDTEGHALGRTLAVRVIGEDDDTEGHAISIHFPSRTEADAFRRRLLVTGALVGTVALGAAGGAGLSALQSDAGPAGSLTSQSDAGYTDRLNEMAATTQGDVSLGNPAQLNEMAATTQSGAADQGSTDRLNEMAATTQSGLAASDRTAADAAQTGRLDRMAATTQAGPAVSPFDQASTDRLDELAATTQAGPAADDEGNERNPLGGPAPR